MGLPLLRCDQQDIRLIAQKHLRSWEGRGLAQRPAASIRGANPSSSALNNDKPTSNTNLSAKTAFSLKRTKFFSAKLPQNQSLHTHCSLWSLQMITPSLSSQVCSNPEMLTPKAAFVCATVPFSGRRPEEIFTGTIKKRLNDRKKRPVYALTG